MELCIDYGKTSGFGTIIDNAILDREQMIKETYGVKLNWINATRWAMQDALETATISGNVNYDLAMPRGMNAQAIVTGGFAIPNTEVKLTSADNTCLETDWEDRSMPTQRVWRKSNPLQFASLAQQVENAAVNRRVVGSNPTGGASKRYCRHDIVAAMLLTVWTVSSVGRATGS